MSNRRFETRRQRHAKAQAGLFLGLAMLCAVLALLAGLACYAMLPAANNGNRDASVLVSLLAPLVGISGLAAPLLLAQALIERAAYKRR